jgi:hypothetical protein
VPVRSLADGLPQLIDELVRPPTNAEERQNLAAYLAERIRGRNWRIEFPLLQALALVRGLRPGDVGPLDPAAPARRFAKSPALLGTTQPALAEATGWASAVSGYFAQVFRSAYVANFVLGALAVVSAAVSLLFKDKLPFAFAEALFIVLVIANTVLGSMFHWHRRWIESREVGERLRVSTSLWSLALRPAYFRGEEPSWPGFYARAFTRQLGMRQGALRGEGLATAREVLLALLVDQCRYNAATAERMSKLERRLERFGLALFILTAFVALDHLFGGHMLHALLGLILPHEAGVEGEHVAITLGAALPALATASYGIRVIGDFEGVARRAEQTEEALEHLRRAVETDPPDLGLLRARALETADILLGDLSSWRLAAESRRLALPG